jgi:hypothetical protein
MCRYVSGVTSQRQVAFLGTFAFASMDNNRAVYAGSQDSLPEVASSGFAPYRSGSPADGSFTFDMAAMSARAAKQNMAMPSFQHAYIMPPAPLVPHPSQFSSPRGGPCGSASPNIGRSNAQTPMMPALNPMSASFTHVASPADEPSTPPSKRRTRRSSSEDSDGNWSDTHREGADDPMPKWSVCVLPLCWCWCCHHEVLCCA